MISDGRPSRPIAADGHASPAARPGESVTGSGAGRRDPGIAANSSGPSVSVVVPAGPGATTLAPCLTALAGCQPPPAELIVVVDGGDDEVLETARSAASKVERLAEPMGPAAARNRGAALATGDLLLFIDADVLVATETVGVVQDLFRREPGLAAAFGSYDDQPAAPGLLSQYRNLLHHWVHQQGSDDAFTFWAACGVVRRPIFLEIGGYDESYRRPAIEDIELGYRMRRAGHRIRLLKSLQVKHLKRWSFGNMVITDLLRRAVPWTRLLLRNGRVTSDLNLNRSGQASVALAGLGLAALAAAVIWPPALAVTVAAACGLLLANSRLYGFFLSRRGPLFAVGAVLCHWLYFVIGGTGLVLGTAGHLLSAARRSRQGRGPAENRRGR